MNTHTYSSASFIQTLIVLYKVVYCPFAYSAENQVAAWFHAELHL